MRITLIVIGRLKSGGEAVLAARYLDRFSRLGVGVGVEFVRMVELAESRASGGARRRMADEAAQLRRSLPEGAFLVALDERGEDFSSRNFSEMLGRHRDEGCRDMVFVMGGPDGLDPQIRRISGLTLCFGRMTWPHQMARVMLAEQLYRAATILSGHPYHRN